MTRGDFPRRRCEVILVGWWMVIFNTNRSYHEDQVRSLAIAPVGECP
jgi:hypothetical protein